MTEEPKYGRRALKAEQDRVADTAARVAARLEADRLVKALKGDAEPMEVTVVRPPIQGQDVANGLVNTIAAVFIRGALIMVGASWVDVVPDWGYWESVAVGLLGSWIFVRSSGTYRLWTRKPKS